MFNIVDILPNNIDDMVTIISLLFGGGSLVGWFSERKKRRIEEKDLSVSVLDKMQTAYDRFTEDSLERYKNLTKEVQSLNSRLENVTRQLQEEKDKYNNLLKEHNKLRVDYEKLRTLIKK